MTDIASEDGDGSKGTTSPRRSGLASDIQSRPETAKAGASNRPVLSAGPCRENAEALRGSVTGSSGVANRPQSSAKQKPCALSHLACFLPPYERAQATAQRGASRPSTMIRSQQPGGDDAATDAGGSNPRHSIVSATTPVARLARQLTDDGEPLPPPSRGTEMTEQETVDRITANTSPTHGHYPAASLSESVRPLQKKPGGRAPGCRSSSRPFSQRCGLQQAGISEHGVEPPNRRHRGATALGRRNRISQITEAKNASAAPLLASRRPPAPPRRRYRPATASSRPGREEQPEHRRGRPVAPP